MTGTLSSTDTPMQRPSAWSWDSEAYQVALVVQFICRSMVEYESA
jgi:hypothetical protein